MHTVIWREGKWGGRRSIWKDAHKYNRENTQKEKGEERKLKRGENGLPKKRGFGSEEMNGKEGLCQSTYSSSSR